MSKKKLSFKERYPNYRRETRNEVISQMTPATGWWKVIVSEDGLSWIEAVAFFAKVTYESRNVWDNGKTEWEKEEFLFANSGNNEEWFMEYMSAEGNYQNESLFYDPDFRLSREEQQAGEKWIKERIEFLIKKKNDKG